MTAELPDNPKYRNTMQRLENLRHLSRSGSEYWCAREIQAILGYAEWRNFEGVIDRARSSMMVNDISPSHHIVETNKMMKIGNAGQREMREFFLSRAACYLIAMNGDPSKPEIAAAQAYFAVQTRAAEIAHARSEDEKRLELREKVTQSFKTVSGVAKEAGVPSKKQPIFHDARYQGLYGMPRRDVMTARGLGSVDIHRSAIIVAAMFQVAS